MSEFAALAFLGPGAFLLASGLAYLLGPSPRWMIAIALVGIPLALGIFLWAWLESSPTEACHDCGQILGRWMSGVFVFFLLVNAAAWATGAVVGWAVRQTRAS